jgi:phosphoglucosamine mutase
MQEEVQPLSELAKDLTLYPQKLWNIVMEKKVDVLSDASVQALIQRAEQSLGATGRINVRASGTEPKLRVMLEAESEALMLDIGNHLVEELTVTIKTLM